MPLTHGEFDGSEALEDRQVGGGVYDQLRTRERGGKVQRDIEVALDPPE